MKSLRKIIASTAAVLMLMPGAASADNQYVLQDVYDLPVMYLNTAMSRTNVLGIQFAQPYWNTTPLTVPSMSGAIFELRQSGKREAIYAQSVYVNQTTGVISLGGVIRDVCYNQTRTFTTCSNGEQFGKSAEVRLSNSNRIYNSKANLDRQNVFNARGAIKFTGSGSLGQPTFATTAERDRQLGSTPATGSGLAACVVATANCYDGLGGAWVARGNTGVGNATEAAGGIVQLGTVSSQSGSMILSAAGVPTVVQTRYLTATGGSLARKKVPILDNNGRLSGSLLGTGTRNSTTVLKGNQTWGAVTASGIVLMTTKNVASKITGLNATTNTAIDGANLVAAVAGFSVGDLVTINFRGTITRTAGDPLKVVVDMQVNNNPISLNNSGSVISVISSTSSIGVNDANMNFTRTFQTQTGGTLTFTPIYRTYAGGGANIRFNDNTGFDIIRAH